MKTYLSVDVDYWHDARRAEKELEAIVKKAQRLKLPLIAVMNHQQLLPEVNRSKARRLINVDEYSDLADVFIETLECGTWVSYVRWRKEGEYIWIRSAHDYSFGACNGGGKEWDEDVDWGETSSVFNPNKRIARLVNEDCVGVGLCRSPFYARSDVQEVFARVVGKFGVSYKKGRRDEPNFGRKVRPPFRNKLSSTIRSQDDFRGTSLFLRPSSHSARCSSVAFLGGDDRDRNRSLISCSCRISSSRSRI